MKRKYQSIREQNQGFSLIELIVTLLVSGIVIAMAVLLLITGMNSYKTVETSTVLQEESQVAQFYITELFQEASDYTVTNTGLPSGVSTAVEITKGDELYVLAQVGDELRIGKKASAEESLTACINRLVSKKNETFLAAYVSDMSFDANSFAAAIAQGGYMVVEFTYAYGNRSFVSKAVIRLRNVAL